MIYLVFPVLFLFNPVLTGLCGFFLIWGEVGVSQFSSFGVSYLGWV
jgi:hypothetical protein